MAYLNQPVSPCAVWTAGLLFAFLLISACPTVPNLAQFHFNFDLQVLDAYAATKYLLCWFVFTLFFKWEMMKVSVSSLLFENDSLAYSRQAYACHSGSSFVFVCCATTRGRGYDTTIPSHPEQMYPFKQIIRSLIKEMYDLEIIADKKEFISLKQLHSSYYSVLF